jgi:hypothetical protein
MYERAAESGLFGTDHAYERATESGLFGTDHMYERASKLGKREIQTKLELQVGSTLNRIGVGRSKQISGGATTSAHCSAGRCRTG